MTYVTPKGTAIASGGVTSLPEKLYTYRGTKLLKDEPPPRVPNPKGGRVPDPSVYKALRKAKFEAALAEITSGAHPADAPLEAVRRAGVIAGVGEKTAKVYRAELVAQAEESPS